MAVVARDQAQGLPNKKRTKNKQHRLRVPLLWCILRLLAFGLRSLSTCDYAITINDGVCV
jgi:hypothetical protein